MRNTKSNVSKALRQRETFLSLWRRAFVENVRPRIMHIGSILHQTFNIPCVASLFRKNSKQISCVETTLSYTFYSTSLFTSKPLELAPHVLFAAVEIFPP